MKIAMFTTAQVFAEKQTGGQKRFKELYLYLRKDMDVTLYSTDLPSETGLQGYKTVPLVPARQTSLSFISTNARFLMKNLKELKKLGRAGFDRIIVFDVTTAWILCMAGVKHLSLLLRQDIIEYKDISLTVHHASKAKKWIYLYLMKISELICLRRADQVIVQCEYDKQKLLARHKRTLPSLAQRVLVQINNVNPSWIVANYEKAVALGRADDDVARDTMTLAFVGDLSDYRKGFDLLESSLEHLCAEYPNFQAWIIGGGKNLEAYREKYASFERIHFLGHTNNPLVYVLKSDLVVVPSRADSCPNTVMEAMICEVPVIGADAGGIPEILENRAALFLTQASSLEQMLKKCIDDASFREDLLERQQARCRELTFNWAERIQVLLEA